MQILINGLIQGLILALVAIGFSLVYSTTRVFHIALGGIYATAPYILMTVMTIGGNPWLGVSAALVVAALLGLLCEETMHWPFARKNAPAEIHLIASLGMFMVMVQVIVLIWGNDVQVLRAGIDRVYIFGPHLRLTRAQVFGGAGAFSVLAVFFLLQRRSELGLQFRAMADNSTLLSILGRNVRLLRQAVFMVSGLLAACAAIATAYDTGFDPNGGLEAVLTGMVATIIGGRGSFFGAALAAVALGVIRTQVVWYASSRWEEAITFILLVLFLFLRPQGIFGRPMRLEERA